MLPVIDAASEADENIPKILCNIENHMGKSNNLNIFQSFRKLVN